MNSLTIGNAQLQHQKERPAKRVTYNPVTGLTDQVPAMPLDSALSSSSTNPVQNKAVSEAIIDLINKTSHITADVEDNTTDITLLKERTNNNTIAICHNNEAINDLDNSISTLNDKVNTFSDAIEQNTRDIAAVKVAIEGIPETEATVRQHTAALASLTTQVNSNTTAISNEVTRATGVEATLQQAINAVNTQVEALPAATSGNEGRIYQYVGATTANYTNGFFYKCTNTEGVYSWKVVNVQAGGGSEIKFKDSLITTNQPYLYKGECHQIPDWDKINTFIEDKSLNGSCSGFVRDGKFYRSFDFLYSDTASFVVDNRVSGYKGMVGAIPELTKSVVDSRVDVDWYEYVPFVLLDGINTSGISVSAYILHREGERTDQGDTKQRICSSVLTSYLLCNLTDVDDLSTVLGDICVYMPSKPAQFATEYHWLISDGTKTVCLEYINNLPVITNITTNPYITNFYLKDWDGSDLSTTNAHAQGIERWNLIKEGADLEDIAYTHTYSLVGTENVWRSEFNDVWSGGRDITTATLDDDPDLIAVENASKTAWENRTRGDGTWHTQHASVYDFSTKSFKVCTQEDYGTWYSETSENDKVAFFNLPARDDWEDESVVRPFYNQLKSAIDNGKFIIVVETLSGDFDCWVYYTVAYNSVDSSEEDQEWINLINFDGVYTAALEVFPISITANETEIKGDIEIEFDKTDIASVADELFHVVANDLNPVLLEDIGHADYHWKFINSEYDESIGAITGYVFLCSKNGELHKLTVTNSSYQETVIAQIDDTTTDTTHTWSSSKINTQIETKQNKVTASTTDLTAGVSPLATGELYLVYEA